MARARGLPDTMVNRALASCRTRQAITEKANAHSRLKPKPAPAEAAVVTVPGPMKAALMADQSRMETSRFILDPLSRVCPIRHRRGFSVPACLRGPPGRIRWLSAPESHRRL
jgi:hypothetical protein